jgi:hypothetical protein
MVVNNDWLPIETAPRDGDWLHLWCGFSIIGRWSENGRRVKNGWSDDNDGINPIFHVTHWLPIPEPPQDTTP